MYSKGLVYNLSINLLTLLLLVFSSFSIISLSIEPDAAFARCPNGYHRSPDGDCEEVTESSSSSADGSERDDHIGLESSDEKRSSSNSIDNNYPNNNSNVLPSNECLGQADCFKGKVTAIVDGDTLDIDNIRVRLTLVNTPERGEAGYTEAKDLVESACGVGTKALVDEDDGQKEGSFGRLIGLVYCGDYGIDNKKSLNEILLEGGHAVIYQDFCNVSEFSSASWVQTHGC
jgi:micrococcal nuclease